MTLVNARAAFEKAVTDAVVAADATVSMVYDNVRFTTPGKTKKYVSMSVTFNQSTLQNHGAASDYYSGARGEAGGPDGLDRAAGRPGRGRAEQRPFLRHPA